MSSKIRVLSDDTINKIAAGEVIENPASVVKELVENSLDAGATEIIIEIKEGGRQMIRITDNGCGMSGDDALLCLERHATSKLKAVDDIEALITMGFRGEAIPSIASISKFTLLTRQNDPKLPDTPGTMVIVDGGKIVKCSPVECARGTTIEVKALFFNVPVRRKFQKSPAYDAIEISRIVTLMTLAHPEVKFTLISNQETLLLASIYAKETFLDLLNERIQQILGLDFSRGLCPINSVADEFILQGYLGLPSITKHNRTGQYLFINRRAVQSPLVSYAIRDGYGTMLGTGKHPVFILHLTIPGHLIDVNVHPQKREVRLRQEQALKDLIIRSVGEALQQGGHHVSSPSFSQASPELFVPQQHWKSQKSEFQAWPSFIVEPQRFEEVLTTASVPYPPVIDPVTIMPVNQIAVEPSQPQFLLFEAKSEKKSPKVTATIPRYIVAQTTMGNEPESESLLCLIDQRAAHARVIYEKMLRKNSSDLQMQTLLIPYTIDLAPAEAAFLREQLLVIQQLGIQIKEFGPRTFMIDAISQIFGNVDIHQLMLEIIRNLNALEVGSMLVQEIQKRISLSASKAAISGERRLEISEAQALVDQLSVCQMPDYCPNGKATMLKLSAQQIAALFKSSLRP